MLASPLILKLLEFSRWLIRLYGILSNFGMDVARPGIILVLVSVLFAALYGGISLSGSSVISAVSNGIQFSLQQIFKPFDVLSLSTGHPAQWFEVSPFWLAMIAVFQSLITITLVGLLLQAIYRVFNR